MPQQHMNRLALLHLLVHLLLMNKSNSAPLNSSSSLCTSSYDCGNGISIRYPYWHLNDTTSLLYCGYSGFGLYCSDGLPVLTLSTNAYYVTSIDYSAETITLVDTDLVNQTCPTPTQNFSLPSVSNLYYSRLDLNLTFFFNCTTCPLNSQLSPLSCLSSGPNQSYVLAEGDQILQGFDWNFYCEVSVVAPVNRSVNLTNLSLSYVGALQSGFQLDWGRARSCIECEDSGGLCGYNATANETLCFCSGGVRVGSTCHRGAF